MNPIRKLLFFLVLLHFGVPWVVQAQFTVVTSQLPGITKGELSLGDCDNDGDADLLLSGTFMDYTTQRDVLVSDVFINDGFGRFTPVYAGLEPLAESAVAWGDYDNDNDLDILITGKNQRGKPIAKIYRNEGGNRFVDIKAKIQGVTEGAVDWGDYDNDGDLDILMTGFTRQAPNYEATTRIYQNDDGEFNEIYTRFIGVGQSTAEWGDYDGDGDLDFLISGLAVVESGTLEMTKIYRNNGQGIIVDSQQLLPGVSDGVATWDDYDADGDLDILLAGSERLKPAAIYRNDNGRFSALDIELPRATMASGDWGDYDNDGDLDFVLQAFDEKGEPYLSIYDNTGNHHFQLAEEELNPLWLGDLQWGDCDSDNDLDLIITGFNEIFETCLYRNEIDYQNQKPATPGNLALQFNNDSSEVVLKWEPATDSESENKALTYNLWFGNTLSDRRSLSARPHAISTQQFDKGNVGHNTSWRINNLKKGISYYWTVQAIDQGLQGSVYAEEQSFIVGMKVDFEIGQDTVCKGSTIYFTNTSSYVSDYLWKRDNIMFEDDRNASYTFDQPGEYTISLTASNGAFSKTVEKTITVLSLPVAQIGINSSNEICENDSVRLFSVLEEPSYNYLWEYEGKLLPDAADASLYCKEAGEYRLIVDDAQGCSAESEPVKIKVHPLPDNRLRTNTPTEFCAGKSVTIISESGADLSHKWYIDGRPISNANDESYVARQTGRFSAEITNKYGCSVHTNKVEVLVYALPDVTLTSNQPGEICDGTIVNLSVPYNSLNDYQWYKYNREISDATETEFTTENSGTYSVRVVNQQGCANQSEEFDLIVRPLPPAPEIASKTVTAFCYGGSAELFYEPEVDIEYQWHVNGEPIEEATDDVYVVRSTGTYTVVASNQFHCTSESNQLPVKVYLVPQPEITFTGDKTFCAGDTLWLATQYNHQFQYVWYRNERETTEPEHPARYPATRAGNYKVRVTNKICPSFSNEITLNVVPAPHVTLEKPQQDFICGNQPLHLRAKAPAADVYQWFYNGRIIPNASSEILVFNQTGKYNCRITDDKGCSAITPTFEIKEQTTIDFDYENTCDENHVRFEAEAETPYGGVFFNWDFGDGTTSGYKNPEHIFPSGGEYQVQLVVDYQNICTDTLEKTVLVNTTPFVEYAYTQTQTGETEFSFTTLINQEFISSYQWDFGDGNLKNLNSPEKFTHYYENDGTYDVKLTIVSKNNCSSTITRRVIVNR